MKRVFWILITPTLGFLILWGLGNWFIIPRLEVWALQELQNYSKTSLPVEVQADRLRIRVLRPSLALENIRIRPKGEFAKVTEVVRVTRASIHLDFFSLLGGRLNLSALMIDAPEAAIDIDPLMKKDSKPEPLPLDDIFAITEKIPLQKILLNNVHVLVTSEKLGFNIEASNSGLLLTNMGRNITAKLDTPTLAVSLKKVGQFSGSLDSHLYLTRQSLRVLQLGVRLDESEFVARGELTDFKNVTLKPSGVINLSAKVSLADIYKELQDLKPTVSVPKLAGTLDTEIETRFNGLSDISAQADITTHSLNVGKFELGDAHIEGEYKNKAFTFSEVTVNHPAGKALLNKSQFQLNENYDFKSVVKVETLDLQKLFASLDLKSIPVGLQMQGVLPCSGRILPSFQVTCEDGELTGQNLWVKSENSSKGMEIVNLKNFKVTGKTQVTMDAVTYDTNLAIGSSVGTSDGVIDFHKGFKINYKTKKLDMKDIQNLAHLRMIGNASIEGSTQGDSNTATMDMSLNVRDFIFEDFNLGNVISNVKLKKGHLLFENIAGAQNKTQYIGDLDIDLSHDHLVGTFSAPTADLDDIATILESIYRFPLTVAGTGAAKATVEGPLNFWRLNYSLDSAFKNVSAGGENFDQLHFNVDAKNGNIKTRKVQLLKNNSIATVTGGISNDKILNLIVDAKNWRLEESDTINRITTNMYGSLNASAEIKNSFKDARVNVKGALTETVLEDQELENSAFQMSLDAKSLGGQLSLFGDKVQGEFQYPFENATPLKIQMKTNQWTFSSLLALIGGANLANEYESSLTSTIDLRSESGDLFKSTGKILIQNFYLKRGNSSVSNTGPIEIIADNGVTSFKNFMLRGPHNTIKITGTNFTADRLNMNIDAKADLRLLQIFTPFLDDLGGPLRMSAGVSGKVTKPEILGTANLNNAFVKLKGFPHPLERLQANVSFSQTRIIINEIKGQLAGGSVTGDGSVIINGVRDLPTSVRAHLENVSMNVPDRVHTTGDADLLFSGKWFPFVLSGTYRVNGGIFEKEFIEGGASVSSIQQSAYLPKVLRETQFEPVLLDLQINLERPLPVKNSMFDGTVTGNIAVKGPPTNPVLLGKITTERRSKIIFKDRQFDILTANVDFTDPTQINPNLYVSATSRINEYDVQLFAQGSAKNPTIKLTSIPPLSEQDIVSLIALGVTSQSMATTGQSKALADQAGLEVAGGILAGEINKPLEATGFKFGVSSQYDSTRNISVPKITLTRRLTDKMKVSGSRQVGDVSGYDVKLEYLLNPNWTAVGSFENKNMYDNNTLQNTPSETESIFGLDLEFKREFK
ncbi:translocation/assembly module TamB domain-containing protein [Bdellovibrio sp. KM01]|uniref:translocation/assembly module TamB domain-containing protein n=1 Tax=Bdellovibrio sp. KM01 TaxID=2748865 RepID=UPI0015E9D961|nr:translocation/assembly module TamB domain-containing protein [Bdellovibrio sp. KM01]QLY24227.1 translocation/assembly module TamB domain-containing protein [Bdellovibrio sp. KM01]